MHVRSNNHTVQFFKGWLMRLVDGNNNNNNNNNNTSNNNDNNNNNNKLNCNNN